MRQIQRGSPKTERAGGLAEAPSFVPAGQSTQMIVGATPESDFQLMSVAEASLSEIMG